MDITFSSLLISIPEVEIEEADRQQMKHMQNAPAADCPLHPHDQCADNAEPVAGLRARLKLLSLFACESGVMTLKENHIDLLWNYCLNKSQSKQVHDEFYGWMTRLLHHENLQEHVVSVLVPELDFENLTPKGFSFFAANFKWINCHNGKLERKLTRHQTA